MMQRAQLTFERLKIMAGQELGVSRWFTVDQAKIDQFAECTEDRQWIHIDIDRARRESPYRAPVAHGYLTLSLVAAMSYDIGARPEGTAASINYGLDKVRFLAPVRAGSRVRMRSTLLSFEEKAPGQFLMKNSNEVDIEGEERPALIAETLVLLVAEQATPS
jgi:acyl dehydratase